MAERPILFSAPMVRAILAGTKTQTRRVCKSQPYANGFHFDGRDILCHNDWLPPSAMLMDVKRGKDRYAVSDVEGDLLQHCPYGQPGDRLWVRETHALENRYRNVWCTYAADGQRQVVAAPELVTVSKPGMRPSIHMPRWASRITLEVTGVRVERLHDISEADAQAEGCSLECMTPTGDDSGSAIHGPGGYRALWESINGSGSWDTNPWVWVVEFERVA